MNTHNRTFAEGEIPFESLLRVDLNNPFLQGPLHELMMKLFSGWSCQNFLDWNYVIVSGLFGMLRYSISTTVLLLLLIAQSSFGVAVLNKVILSLVVFFGLQQAIGNEIANDPLPWLLALIGF